MRISDCSSDVCTSDLTTTSRGCPGAVRRYVDTPMPRTDLKAHPVIAGGLSVAITSPSAATAGIPLPALAVCSLAMNVAIPIVGPSAKQPGEPSEIDAPRDARHTGRAHA